MKAPEAINILHGLNWTVLAIAIYSPKPLTMEEAFEVYYTGRKRKGGRYCDGENGEIIANKTKEAYYMRKAGITCKEIEEALGINNAAGYVKRYKERGLKACQRVKPTMPSRTKATEHGI